MSPQAARLHAALPQTQCTRCGYPDCAGYARAMADGAAAINRCPPGGADGVARLVALTGQDPVPLNPVHGTEGPRAVAVIDESWCVGCTLCLEVCPTDAILGANKFMHTVIERYCTGCELCLPVCPVDCIAMDNVTGSRAGWQAWSQAQADEALRRYEARCARLAHGAGHDTDTQQGSPAAPIAAKQPQESTDSDVRKKSVIEAALARARARKSGKA